MSDNEHFIAADRAYSGKELFPIREVARLTGVNPVTLRAWERRYGLIQPTRTESGHRLYSLTDVAEVRAILGWLERGVAVSKVGTLIARNPAPVDPSPIAYHKGDSDCRHWRDRITGAVQGFNEATLARLYGEVFSTYPMATAFNQVFLPVWENARLHQEAFGRASEWAFLDAFLRGQALKRLQFAQRETAEHHVLLCGIPGQYHELELLVAALLLGGEYVRVQPLGTGQPLEELGLVSERIQPHAVILFSNHAPSADAGRRFMKLGLNLSCPLLLAGEMSELIHDQLVHSPIACLGGNSQLMQRRLLQYIAGHLDT
ncbi:MULTISPECIES: MerR family transcriptional regulator [Pseudomonas]|uniref:MerR family transcriptional regulator n=1 Tax=Pseudomonas quercus TaxID=2722792 RepID=A0ABX0YEG1_9PSED|nr:MULTISPECIES: MerR family transcriptional regulator [Pseudomonas]MBF7141885.1 MerR family transcriptional regulator [Pseudomonas sp. LY10J]NJP00423.1 MerR family transcriptional regulator [Pseudomonas quercus]